MLTAEVFVNQYLDELFAKTYLEIASPIVEDLVGSKYPAKLVDIKTVKPESNPIDETGDKYQITAYANNAFSILNTETGTTLIYNLVTESDINSVRYAIRSLANFGPVIHDPTIITEQWTLMPVFAHFPLFRHGIGLIHREFEVPYNAELTLLGPGFNLYPLRDDNDKLYGVHIYFKYFEELYVLELIASDAVKQIPEVETISKATHQVEINLGDPLLKYHKEIDLRKIATTRGWGCAEVTNGYLSLIKTA
ncbi:hypothetical protein BZX16_24425 [Salmonella enterica subsp. enterica serovar Enteritidis]|nr:hypothetical protein [Salmonella enterica subsp. enterica serovar Enteritidis]